jgi:hypothetical protein
LSKNHKKTDVLLHAEQEEPTQEKAVIIMHETKKAPKNKVGEKKIINRQ